MASGFSSPSKLVKRLIPEDGKRLVNARDGEDDYGTFAFPGRRAIPALDIDARLGQQVGHLIECTGFILQAENKRGFFCELDFGGSQGGARPLKVGDEKPELARAGDFGSGKGFDVDASLGEDGGNLGHDAWPALTADDQLCGGWHGSPYLRPCNTYHFLEVHRNCGITCCCCRP